MPGTRGASGKLGSESVDVAGAVLDISGPMSHENIEVARHYNALFNSGDREELFDYLQPDVEWCDLMHAPDAPELVRGVAAVREIVAQWDAAFDEFAAEVGEFIDAGDCVVTVTHWRGNGKSSGLAIDLHVAEVAEFSDGKVARITLGYPSKAAALEAVKHRARIGRGSA